MQLMLADYIISCNGHSGALQCMVDDDGHCFQVVVYEFVHVAAVQYMLVLRQLHRLAEGFA